MTVSTPVRPRTSTSVVGRPRAAIYARLSQVDASLYGTDREDSNVEDQVRKARLYCQEKDFEVVEVFVENDLSAAKYRPVYEDLSEKLEGGTFDVVVLGSRPDRLYRKPSDLERLALIGDRFPLGIHSVESSHIDLTTADGRYIARLLAATAYRELEVTSERIRASKDRTRREGRLMGTGQRPFGFDAEVLEGLSKTGRPRFRLTGELDEKEAEVIRESARRVLRGDSLRSLGRFWYDEGLRNSSGGKVAPSVIRKVLLNPRTAGLSARLVDRGKALYEVVGVGQWPAILEPEVQDRLRLVLSDPSRSTRGGRPRDDEDEERSTFWLNGLLFCSECSSRLYQGYQVRRTKKDGTVVQPPIYRCRKEVGCGLVSVSKTKVEDYVRSLFVEYAKDESLSELEAAVEEALGSLSSERTRLLSELDRLSEVRTGLLERAGNGVLTEKDLDVALSSNSEKTSEVRESLERLVSQTVASGGLDLLKNLDDVGDLDDEDCRRVARSMFEKVYISSAKNDRHAPIQDRVRPIFR